MPKRKTTFRDDINFLRAIAVTGVLLYHFKVPYTTGGFSGVDIFFVISGYLMTQIIDHAIDQKKFSFKDYIGKRIKRIVPALLFLILLLTFLAYFFYFPEDYKLNQRNAASSLLFLSNLLYWRTTGYFEPSSATNILLHTWSLSVEWQFYLIYPFILLFLRKLFIHKKNLLLFLAGCTLLLFIFSVILTHFKASASFYLLPSRAWEMLIGGIAFFLGDIIQAKSWKRLLSTLGYVTILACFVFLHTSMAWPGLFTLLPVLATFLIIVANYPDFPITRQAQVQFIGKISYSLYLWHWPIYVISQYWGLELNTITIPILILLSLSFGLLSYKYIESIQFNSSKQILLASLLLFLVTGSGYYHHFNRHLFKPQSLEIAGYTSNYEQEMERLTIGNCFLVTDRMEMKDYNADGCLFIDPQKKNILLLGDSHAAHVAQSLQEGFQEQGINLLKAAATGGLPTLKPRNGNNQTLEAVMNYIYQDFIPKNYKSINGVIVTAHWSKDKTISNREVLDGIKEIIAYFNKFNIKTIILGQSEVYTIPFPAIAAKNYQYGIDIRQKFLEKDSRNLNNYLKQNLTLNYVEMIHLNSFPLVSETNVPYMLDQDHFTRYGSDLVIKQMFQDEKFISFYKE